MKNEWVDKKHDEKSEHERHFLFANDAYLDQFSPTTHDKIGFLHVFRMFISPFDVNKHYVNSTALFYK